MDKKRSRPSGGAVRIGVSGYDYPAWRGHFYPSDLPRRAWLSYASEAFCSIELNGTFYCLESPAVFERWAHEVPPGFVFAVKGSRFITHVKRLKDPSLPLSNFFASGLLALGSSLGPVLWQLPPHFEFDEARVRAFISLLPTDTHEAERLAQHHDLRLSHGARLTAVSQEAIRHAFEVRDPSFLCPAFFELLRARGMGVVVADTASRFPYVEEITSDFVYVRLHGSRALYASSYADDELAAWGRKIARWSRDGLDVFVYFDNDREAFAPLDARRLIERMQQASSARVVKPPRRSHAAVASPARA